MKVLDSLKHEVIKIIKPKVIHIFFMYVSMPKC